MAFGSGEFTRITGGPLHHFEEYTTTNAYVLRTFGSEANTITVVNDDTTTNNVQLSWDGATLEAVLKPYETITMNTYSKTGIYVKSTAGGAVVRIWAW